MDYQKKNNAYILLGGNLDDRLATLLKAKKNIENEIGKVVKASGIYRSEAWGKTDQPEFLNQVLLVETELKPEELLRVIQEIEIRLGRVRYEKWGERKIDIDILFYNDLVIESKSLTIPHPYLQDRLFTLIPLSEISNGLIHPVLKKDIKTLLNYCPDNLSVEIFEPAFTN